MSEEEIVTTTMSLSQQAHKEERRKGTFEDTLCNDELFNDFERWLKTDDLINKLYFYRDVYEWKQNRDIGILEDDDDWREVATNIITGFLLSNSERPFGVMIEDGSEIRLEHDMFDGLAEDVLDTLRLKFIVFQAELNIMVSPGMKQGSVSNDPQEPLAGSHTSSNKGKVNYVLKKPEQAFAKQLKTDEFFQEYQDFLHESFPDTPPSLYLNFFSRVEAFEKAHADTPGETSDHMKRQMCCIEAVKLFEDFFKEPKVELTAISPVVQKRLSLLLQPPSEPPAAEVNAYMFSAAKVEAIRYLFAETYRVYRKNKKGKKGDEQEEAPPPPPPHVIQREMFNIYPEGSESQIFWDSLADEIWLPKFRAWMEKEIATENLNCWQDIQAFRKKYYQENGEKICTPELVEDATVIFERYIKKGCKELININYKMSAALHTKFQGENFPNDINQNIFLDVQREAFTIMTGNHYRPFTAAEQQAAAEAAAAAAAEAQALADLKDKKRRQRAERKKKEEEAKKRAAEKAAASKTPRSPKSPRPEPASTSPSQSPTISPASTTPAVFDFGADLGDLVL